MTWFDKVRTCLIYTTAIILIVLAVAFSVLRSILPYATDYVNDVERELSLQIDLPVSIASIDADMYWLLPRLKLVDVVIYNKEKNRELLRLDEAFFALAFIDSIIQWSPTVGDVSLVGADLNIERFSENKWRIQGVEFGGEVENSSTGKFISAIKNINFSLLDSNIHWKDYQLSKEPLDFIGANIFIEEFLGDHSLELSLKLPESYGRFLRLIIKANGDITQFPAIDLDIYLKADSINLEKWASVLDIAELPSLKGIFSGEVWLSQEDNVISKVEMETSVEQLNVARKKYGDFSLQYLTGKFGWEKSDHGWDFTSSDISMIKQATAWPRKSSISIIRDTGSVLLTSTYLRSQDVIDIARVFVDYDKFNSLKSYRLSDFSGDFYNLSIFKPADSNDDIKFSADLSNLNFYVPDTDIIFHGVDGRLAYEAGNARIEVLSEAVDMNFGKLFRQPLHADLIEGVVDVKRANGEWNIYSKNFYFLNSDIEINTRLSLTRDQTGVLNADIQSDFINLIGSELHKYYPVSIMSKGLVDWLDMAITDGFIESGNFVLRGDLSRIPYQNNEGVIQLNLDASYMSLKFLEGWPRLENFKGNVRIHNSSVFLTNVSGNTYSINMNGANASIPDVLKPRLFLVGSGFAPAKDLQRYVQTSGLKNVMGDIVKQFEANGDTELQMSIEVPLNNKDPVLTKGLLQLKGNDLYLPAMDYELKNVLGSMSFEGDQLSAKQIKGVFEGANVNVDVHSTDFDTAIKKGNKKEAGIVFNITGHLPADGILKKFTWIPKSWVGGSSDWNVLVFFPKLRDDYYMRVESNSTLEGTSIALSDVISKKESTTLKVDFELKALEDSLQVDLKSEENFSFSATRGDNHIWDFMVDSSLIRGKGKSAEDLNNESTSYLDLDYIDLVKVFSSTNNGGSPVSLPPTFFPSLSFKVKELDWYDWKFNDVKLETSWHLHGMLVNSVDFTGPSLKVNARGSWLTSWKNKHESNFKIFVTSDDLGNTLSTLNISDAMKRGKYSTTIDWQWFGEPYKFSWETVRGNSHFTMKDGEVRALDPGAGGRFVGFFNVFNIFDRLMLKFDDISGEGFVFDHVEGDYEFRDGYALTENIEVSASAADMKLTGKIGMVEKNYDMLMQVKPHSSAAAFTTGAIAGGAILGAGLVLINKLFGLEEGVSDDYTITGSWGDPVVKKINGNNAGE